jgi:hypothetical protein
MALVLQTTTCDISPLVPCRLIATIYVAGLKQMGEILFGTTDIAVILNTNSFVSTPVSLIEIDSLIVREIGIPKLTIPVTAGTGVLPRINAQNASLDFHDTWSKISSPEISSPEFTHPGNFTPKKTDPQKFVPWKSHLQEI